MKNKKLWVGIPLIILVFGIMLIGCDQMIENDEIVGKWYDTQEKANQAESDNTIKATFEFTEGKRLLMKSGEQFEYKVSSGLSGKTLTLIMSGGSQEIGKTTYDINSSLTMLTINKKVGTLYAGIYYKAGGDNETIEYKDVTFNTVTTDGPSTQTTTQLILNFSDAITDLIASDITLSGVPGVTKGTLTGSNPYILPITVTSSGILSVDVYKDGYFINDPIKSVAIWYIAESSSATAVTFSSVTANGSTTQTTTQLTLTFNNAITGLAADDITLSGVSGVNKGTLSGSGPTYTLSIDGFTSVGILNVMVSKSGFNITNATQQVIIYYVSGSEPSYTFYIKLFGYSDKDSYFGSLTDAGMFKHVPITDSSFAWEVANNFNGTNPTVYTRTQLVDYMKTLGLTTTEAGNEAAWLLDPERNHGYFGVRVGQNVQLILK